ncbi:MAG: peptidylprolyl isomerase [Enterobacteriaceae bacterium]|nr:peptidylprolyl isomerase [Enterobacteriaceae bacterium]
MMDNLRTAANGPVLKIVLALIILTFLVTGVTGFLSNESGNYAAKVNGQTISQAQLEQAFQQEKASLQERLGDKSAALLSNDQEVKLLRRQSLDSLINTVLLDQYVNKLGLSASDEQIKAEIRRQPYFQTNGKFDNNKYLEVLNNARQTPDAYAEQVRRELIIRQLNAALMSTEIALPTEIKQQAALLLQKRTVRLATLELKSIEAQQTVTEQEVKNYYDMNSKQFTVPEKVKVSYIKMDAADELKNITITDADIEKYYKSNLSKYTQPERKKYSIIQQSSEADAKSILDELKKGADFSKLAAEKSTDKYSAQRGGDLGWMEDTSLPNEIKLAHLTEKGQLSKAIKLSNGYAIFRLDDIKAQVVKPLEDERSEIEKTVKQDKAINAFYALQQKVSEAATNDNESLAAAEQAAGYKAVTTDWFDKGHIPADINFNPVIQSIFFGNLIDNNSPSGTNSDVISVDGDRAFILRVDDVKPEFIQPFDAAKAQVTELVKRQKAEKQLQVDGEKLLTALKEGKGEQALKAAGIGFGEPTVMTQESQSSPETKVIFTLPHPKENKPVYGLTQNELGNIVLIQLDKVTPGSIPEDQIQQIMTRESYQIANTMLESLLVNLRNETEIKIGQID